MQDAFVSETVAIGNWTIIGYKGPGDESTKGTAAGGTVSQTTNFTFKDASKFANNSATLDATGLVGFTATSRAKLNDCALGSTWELKVAVGASAGEAAFTPQGTATTSQDCVALTPNYKTIGK